MGMLSDFLTLIKGTQTNLEGVVTGENGKLISTPINSGANSLVTADKTVGLFSTVVSKNASKTYKLTAGTDAAIFTFSFGTNTQDIWEVYVSSVGGFAISQIGSIENVIVSSTVPYELVVTNNSTTAVAVKVIVFSGSIEEKTT